MSKIKHRIEKKYLHADCLECGWSINSDNKIKKGCIKGSIKQSASQHSSALSHSVVVDERVWTGYFQ